MVAWLDQLALDQQQTAERLRALPPTTALLHELALPGAEGLVDHLVVSSGGTFIVVTRRCDAGLHTIDGVLWTGDQPLGPDLERVRDAAVSMTQLLGTPVVPVVALVGAALPPGTSLMEGGALLAPADRLVFTLSTASHTSLSSADIATIVERAAVHLVHPVRAVRPDRRSEPRGRETSGAGSSEMGAEQVEHSDGAPSDGAALGIRGDDVLGSDTVSSATPRRRFPLALVCAALVAAAASGLIARAWSSSADAPASSAPASTAAEERSSPPTAAPTLIAPMAASVLAPSVGFAPKCPSSGAGWTLTPLWPGELTNLAEYVLEVRTLDGSWRRQGAFASPAETAASALVGQQPKALFAARITAVMVDGSASLNSPTLVQVPTGSC